MNSARSPPDEPASAREQLILDALASRDLVALRALAARPGGLLSDNLRRRVWPFFLGVIENDPGQMVDDRDEVQDEGDPDDNGDEDSTGPATTLASPRLDGLDRGRLKNPRSLTSAAFEDSATSKIASDGLGASWVTPSSHFESTILDSDAASSIAASSTRVSTAHSESDDKGLEESWLSSTSPCSSTTSLPQHEPASSSSTKTDDENDDDDEGDEQPAGKTGSELRAVSGDGHASKPLASSDVFFPSPTASFAGLPPPLLSPLPTYSSSASSAREERVDWGLFERLGGSDTLPAHQDEGQIRLDTRRSFVVYPAVAPDKKMALQTQLHALIVTVLRRHPPFRYFQGYHDIASVLLLTFLPLPSLLPPPVQFSSRSSSRTGSRGSRSRSRESSGRALESFARTSPAVARPVTPTPPTKAELATLVASLERLTVFRIRDGMGTGLEPVMGYLRLFKRVLYAADPPLSAFVNQASPLPFFALSWLLTLFSHDVGSLPQIQPIFDFLLAHNPAMSVYLAVAIILTKRPLIESLAPELADDPGLLHQMLSSLPILVPAAPSLASPLANSKTPVEPVAAPAPFHERGDGEIPPPGSDVPVPLPELFALATSLWARFPLKHPQVRAEELLGERSVVFTYEEEWRASTTAAMATTEVAAEDEAELATDAAPTTKGMTVQEAEEVVARLDLMARDPPDDFDEAFELSPEDEEKSSRLLGRAGNEKAEWNDEKRGRRSRRRRSSTGGAAGDGSRPSWWVSATPSTAVVLGVGAALVAVGLAAWLGGGGNRGGAHPLWGATTLAMSELAAGRWLGSQ